MINCELISLLGIIKWFHYLVRSTTSRLVALLCFKHSKLNAFAIQFIFVKNFVHFYWYFCLSFFSHLTHWCCWTCTKNRDERFDFIKSKCLSHIFQMIFPQNFCRFLRLRNIYFIIWRKKIKRLQWRKIKNWDWTKFSNVTLSKWTGQKTKFS